LKEDRNGPIKAELRKTEELSKKIENSDRRIHRNKIYRTSDR